MSGEDGSGWSSDKAADGLVRVVLMEARRRMESVSIAVALHDAVFREIANS